MALKVLVAEQVARNRVGEEDSEEEEMVIRVAEGSEGNGLGQDQLGIREGLPGRRSAVSGTAGPRAEAR